MVANAVKLFLWPGQKRLLEDTDKATHCLAAGVGYGKTVFAPRWHYVRCKKVVGASRSFVAAPSVRLLKHVCLNAYRDFLISIGWAEGIHFTINLNDLFVDLLPLQHKVFLLSSETWKKVHGWEFTHGWIDEPGYMQGEMFTFLAERTRSPMIDRNQLLYTGVPQGLTAYYDHFTGDQFAPSGDYEVIEDDKKLKLTRYRESPTKLVMHASTHENTLLPTSYLAQLREAYGWNEDLWAAHVNGLFVPITDDRVYCTFRQQTNCGEYKPERDIPNLYVTFDFNVGKMSWVAVQQKNGAHFVVKENRKRCIGTDEACDQFIELFPPHEWATYRDKYGDTNTREIVVYGDPAGYARDTRTASQRYGNDYDIIRGKLLPHYPGLKILAANAHPPVRTRITIVNRLFGNNKLFIDRSCSKLIESFNSTTFDKNGNIKKPSGEHWTHPSDAFGYYACEEARLVFDTQYLGSAFL